MSTFFLRRLVLAAALAVMPLQGVAATLTVLLCHGDAQAHGMHAATAESHDHGGHVAAHSHAPGAASHDESGGNNGASYHLCCNLTASAPASISIDASLPNFPVRAIVPDTLHDLFVPDQPQRPPLA
jgi:hypothetical protein